jgi:hypothetical protein
MGGKKFFRLPVVFFVLAGTLSLSAQTPSEEPPKDSAAGGPAAEGDAGFYYIENADEEIRIIQHLAWEDDENALRFELVIEKLDDQDYTEILRTFVTESFAEASLTPGDYRYKIVPHDLLDRPYGNPAWTDLTILPAYTPELSGFAPNFFYLDEDVRWELTLNGRHIQKGAEVFLRIREGETVIRPRLLVVDDDGEQAVLVFAMNTLVTGQFDIHVINPGGIETSLGVFGITFRKPVDINVSLGYAPVIPLYGYIFNTFDGKFFPLGVYARLELIPIKQVWGYLGFELEGGLTSLTEETADYNITTRLIGLHFDFLYQKWLSNRVMSINFRLGGGADTFYKLYFEHQGASASEPIHSWIFSMLAGVSFRWFIGKPYFMETGLAYTHVFSKISPAPGFIRAAVGIGRQF